MTGVSTTSRRPTPGRDRRWLALRLGVVAGLMSVGFVAIAHKAYQVQIVDGARLKRLGKAQYLKELEVPAPRGPILDRSGAVLATSVEVPSVFANPREVVDAAAAAQKLAPILGLPAAELEGKLGSGRRFTWLKRRVSVDEAKAVHALVLPGVGTTPEAKRLYPGGTIGGPLLGHAGLDGNGLEGIELALEDRLAGERAKVAVLRDARGQTLLHGGWEEEDAHASAGDTVVLTIDRVIQHIAERALADVVSENKAKFGVAVVLDARSGEVLAMASMPTYDPSDPNQREGARNRPVTDAYEPGSGMKIFTVAAALDSGAVAAGDTFTADNGQIRVGRKVIKDSHYEKPVLDVSEIIQISSNVGAVKIARRLGKERLHAALVAFGFGRKTGIELPGERAGRVRETTLWGEIGLATASFGYGMTVTPLQLAAAFVVIAAGGVWRAPHVVKEVRDPAGRVVWRPTSADHPVLRAETARTVLGMMERVMEKGGTGDKIKVPGFRVGGKTGTAKKLDPVTRKYTADKYLSSFSGIVPVDDPRLVIVVMIDEPSAGKYYGGAVAGPAFARIAAEALKYMGIAPTEPVAPEVSAAGKERAKRATGERSEADDAEGLDDFDVDELAAGVDPADLPPAGPGEAIVVIPDFTGMSVGQAVRAARAAGVQVEIDGSGRATKQFPGAGRALKSITCRITFDPG